MPTALTPTPARPAASRFERLVRAYPEEIHPLFDRWFSEPLRAHLAQRPLTQGSRVLDLAAGAGDLADVWRQTSATVVAAEPSSAFCALLMEGPSHAAYDGVVRIDEDLLPFGADRFDAVLARDRADEPVDLSDSLPELVRVCRPGGRIAVCAALANTWQEPLDLLDETLRRQGQATAREALRRHRDRRPTPASLQDRLRSLPLTDVEVQLEDKQVLFRSGREFFFSALVDLGPLRSWKALVGKGQPLQAAFAGVKDAIDTYYAGRPFTVTVSTATLTARKTNTP